MIYTRKSIVSGDMIDAETNFSVIGVFRAVESGVTEMMAQLKIDGITAKKYYNAMWVFAKNRIKFLKNIPWGDGYSVESFITAFSLVKLNIETAIKNADGMICAYAKTELCALDLETGRIRKTSTVGLDESFVREPSLVAVDFTKWDENNLSLADTVKVRSTDIDFCHHTNNVEYVKFILNTYSVEDLINKPVREIEINYVNQSFENEELSVYKAVRDEVDCVIIKKQDQTIIKCEIVR